jgi:hypothetical protein
MLCILTGLVLTTPASLVAESRPFGASLEGNAAPVPDPNNPCLLTNTESGKGRAVHMGVITWASAETVNFCSNPAGAEVQGEFVMRAADGDELVGTYVTLAHPDFVTGVITFSGEWKIVGGTGRFAQATGTGTLTGEGSLLPPFGVIASFVGTVSF